jgi:hypothetical protein
MSSCAETAAHQNTNKLEETEVVCAVRARIDHPPRFVLSRLVPVVGGGNEQAQIIVGSQFSRNICEKLPVWSCLAHHVLALESDSKGKVGVGAFGLEWPQESRRYFQELAVRLCE